MARIFSLWVGSNLSVYEKLTLASALKHNHDFTLFSYEPLEVPTGIIIADANLVIPKSEIKQINQSFASFSNRFRYTVLLSQSFDAWVDMDIVLNSEKLPSNMGYRFGYENKRVVNNAVVGYPAESVLAKKLILNSEIGRAHV